MKIAILGANSHIAKGLIENFSKDDITLELFTRSIPILQNFLDSLQTKISHNRYQGYNQFDSHSFNVIINCIGTGTNNKPSDWFTVTETYDNLILKNLQRHPNTLYINFSSGAIYGRHPFPFQKHTINHIAPNQITPKDYYSMVTLNSEVKHRSFSQLNIIDLRLFSYFSKYINLSEGYFITELLNSILKKQLFKTTGFDFTRDYIHPDDLYNIINHFITSPNINTSFDVSSKKPVTKNEMLNYFTLNHNLKWDIDNSIKDSRTGNKINYYSEHNTLPTVPKFTSLQTIEKESKFILEHNKWTKVPYMIK